MDDLLVLFILVVVIIFGGYLTAESKSKVWKHVGFGVVVLGSLAQFAIQDMGNKKYQDQESLERDEIIDLQRKLSLVQENSRIEAKDAQSEIVRLQDELAAELKKSFELSQQLFGHVTGGKSFAYLHVSIPPNSSSITLSLFLDGDYALHDMHLTVESANQDPVHSLPGLAMPGATMPGGPAFVPVWKQQWVEFGEASIPSFPGPPVPSDSLVYIEATFHARNGSTAAQ